VKLPVFIRILGNLQANDCSLTGGLKTLYPYDSPVNNDMTSLEEVQHERLQYGIAGKSKWASRFIWAAVAQGLVATIATILILDPLSYFNINLYYGPSYVIAAGGGGTWMFTGYILYLVVGVVAVAVTALFYFYFEGIQGRVYTGLANLLAWGHYLFMNVGVAGSMILMMYGGYIAGWEAGALKYTNAQIHVADLSKVEEPIGALVLIACLGALFGGLGFLLNHYYSKRQ
jgi:hypothetical protein